MRNRIVQLVPASTVLLGQRPVRAGRDQGCQAECRAGTDCTADIARRGALGEARAGARR